MSLLGNERGMNVRQDAALGDGHAVQQLVQLFIVADGQLEVTRDDSDLFVVTGSIAGQFENLGDEVFDDCKR